MQQEADIAQKESTILWLFWGCVEKGRKQPGSSVGGRGVLGEVDV